MRFIMALKRCSSFYVSVSCTNVRDNHIGNELLLHTTLSECSHRLHCDRYYLQVIAEDHFGQGQSFDCCGRWLQAAYSQQRAECV